ncbi:MAG: CDP-diacylglycerol--glycerol-3-phosphate 3-phosphatidyltransferase [Proteobacteria bacterium]|nr:CDP-diacylglycerol--glycerol-3-phosphate 3-phosphatidyltransferase [Pseudomonadota bacterium]
MIYSVANILTFLRILITPLLVVVYYFLPEHWGMPLAAALFGVASVTDWLDGYLARKLDQVSKLGAFLDPIADKLIIVTVLVVIVDRHGQLFILVPALIIIARELVVSGLREWMSELGKRDSVAVSMLGKLKTAAQMMALFFLLYYYPVLGIPVFEIGVLLLYVAVVLTLWSMMLYISRAARSYQG